MKINEGTIDRVVRGVVGAALIGLGFTGVIPGGWGIAAGILGLALLATGALGFCPIYTLFGFSTVPKK